MDYKILVLPLVLLIISNVLTSPVDTNRDKRTIHFIFNHFANALGGIDWNHNNGNAKFVKSKTIVTQPLVVAQKQAIVPMNTDSGFNLPVFMAQLINQTPQLAPRIDVTSAPMPITETTTMATTTTPTTITTTTTEAAVEMIPEDIETTTNGPSKINIPLEITSTAAPQTTMVPVVEMTTGASAAPNTESAESEESSSSIVDSDDSNESTEAIEINDNVEGTNEENSLNGNIASPRSSAVTGYSSMNINNQGATFWGRQPIMTAQFNNQFSQNGNYLPPQQQYQPPSYYYQPPYQALPYQGPQAQQYTAAHPPSMDLAAPSVSTGHSRVKMHDNEFEHYTYHHPAAPSAIYQPAVPQHQQIAYFGNRRWN